MVLTTKSASGIPEKEERNWKIEKDEEGKGYLVRLDKKPVKKEEAPVEEKKKKKSKK